MTFTHEQQDAITSRGENLLVAAGAGSGKTTVLVERILSYLREGGQIDRILALTFTNAAASDMRRKIDEALTAFAAAAEEEALHHHLSAQLALLPKAGISTLHAFCLELLRRYHYRLGLDPAFRVAGEADLAVIREAVMDELLEAEYAADADAANTSGISALADAYGGKYGDDAIPELIYSLYDYSRSRPDPADWLLHAADAYRLPADAHPVAWLDASLWAEEALLCLNRELDRSVQEMEFALSQPELLPNTWYLQLCDERSLLLAAKKHGATFSAMIHALTEVQFGTLRKPGKKDQKQAGPDDPFTQQDIDDAMERAKAYRKSAWDRVKDLKKRYANRTAADFARELSLLYPLACTLSHLVLSYGEKLDAEKSRRRMIDFGDMEHLTLRLLQDAEVAAELKNSLDQVLVDEYQDVNEVQEKILRRIMPQQGFFAVGDVKQSIYRFRLAEPGLFLHKSHCYQRLEDGRRIDLNRNFRSLPPVLSAVNGVFRQIMTESAAELDYTDAEALIPGAPPDTPAEGFPLPVLHLLRAEEENGKPLPPLATETKAILAHAFALRKQGYDWSDMAILLRKRKDIQTVSRILTEAGVPALIQQPKEEETPERLLILSLLAIIDNPHQDIPLAAALRSPVIGFSDDDLACIRLLDKQGDYYRCLQLAAAEDSPLGKRCAAFCARLDSWRQLAEEAPPSRILARVLEDTGLYHLLGAMEGGSEKQQTADRIRDAALRYEESGYAGLTRFLARLQTESGGPEESGSRQGINLLTIHKSKGLEFPVVFLSGLTGRFSDKDTTPDVIWDKGLGLGLRMNDRENGIRYASLSHLAVARRLRRQSQAEEMRVLYVAMTRAKERLILTAALREPEKEIAKWAASCGTEPLLPLDVLLGARCYLDWLGPALIRHTDAAPLRAAIGVTTLPFHGEGDWQMLLADAATLPEAEAGAADGSLPADTDDAADAADIAAEGCPPQIAERLDYRYPMAALCTYPAKWSVSARNRLHKATEETEEAALTPAARTEEAEDAALSADTAITADTTADDIATAEAQAERRRLAMVRGTAIHRVLELLDLSRTTEAEIAAQIREFTAARLLSEEQAPWVNPSRLAALFAADGPMQKMRRAKRVRRETPFTILMPTETAAEENALLQGVLDAAYEEEDGSWVLLDYKTGGKGADDETLRERYREQVACYRHAIQTLWGCSVSACYLVMVDDGRCIRV